MRVNIYDAVAAIADDPDDIIILYTDSEGGYRKNAPNGCVPVCAASFETRKKRKWNRKTGELTPVPSALPIPTMLSSASRAVPIPHYRAKAESLGKIKSDILHNAEEVATAFVGAKYSRHLRSALALTYMQFMKDVSDGKYE